MSIVFEFVFFAVKLCCEKALFTFVGIFDVFVFEREDYFWITF